MEKSANIILITDDQHRYDYLDMLDKFPVKTPNLARLAKEGIWYQHAYTPSPLCMPARSSLHNGLYAHQHGMTTNVGHWDFHLPTVQQALQKHGFNTVAIGKLHAFEAMDCGLDVTTTEPQIKALGYDYVHEVSGKGLAWHCDCEWTHAMARKQHLQPYREARTLYNDHRAHSFMLDEEDYMDRYIGDHVVDFLGNYAYEKPLFLWAGFVSPHPPFDATSDMLAGHESSEQPDAIDNPAPRSWEEVRAHYTAMVEEIDRQVGRILTVLEEKGQLDNTLVVFTSDHGEMLGDHGLEGKCHCYDPSTRVPLLMRYPAAIPTEQVRDCMVELTDLPATFLDAAGITSDATDLLPGTPGKSLLPTWADSEASIRPFVFSEDGGQFYPSFQMIRTVSHKLVYYPEEDRLTLYDMVNDPDECVDLGSCDNHVTIRNDLLRRLLRHLACNPAPTRK